MGFHDIRVHYNDSISYIRNVDSDKYNHMELVADCCENVLSNVPSNHGVALDLHYFKPRSNFRVDITSDNDILTMFHLYRNTSEIDVFFVVADTSPPFTSTENLEIVTIPQEHTFSPFASTLNPDIVNNSQQFRSPPFTNTEYGSSSAHRRGFQSGGDFMKEMFKNVDSYSDLDWTELGDCDNSVEEVEVFAYSDSEDEDWSEKSEDGGKSSSGVSDELDDTEEEGSLGGISNYESDDGEGIFSDDEVDVETINADRYMKGKMFEIKKGEKIVLEKGMIFEDVSHFRCVLKEFAIERGFRLVRVKNEKTRVTAQCGGAGCSWRIHASPLPDGVTYKIKSLVADHTCVRMERNAEATSTWIAEKLMRTLRGNPSMTIEAIYDELTEKYGVEASRMQIYRGKRKAIEIIEGNHAKSYRKLGQYAVEIRRTNPGSLVKIELERIPPNMNLPTFKRFFISFEAIQQGFKDGCRPFIGLDGCHLKGPYGGILLAAVALDGNNGLYPIAIGVVESEGKDSWAFFLYYLNSIIDGPQRKPWAIMTDGQKGIDSAIHQVMPDATHRSCCRHLFSNFKKKFHGVKLRRLFWAAARAYTSRDFNSAMGEIKELSAEAFSWLKKVPVAEWARHTSNPQVKCDHITNNLVESFNNWVGNTRGKPILTMMEMIRCKLMGKLQKRFDEAGEWKSLSLVTPTIRKKLDEVSFQSRQCKITFAGQNEYQVIEGVMSHVVNLQARTCCCKVWEISGIPCKHAAACIAHKRVNLEEYCDTYYKKYIFLRAYGGIIHPIHDESMWGEVPGDPIQPPPLKRQKGRPRKSRKREHDEAVAGTSESRRSCTVKCATCGQIGHNRRTCQRAPVRASSRGKSASGRSTTRGEARGAASTRGRSSRGRDRVNGVKNAGVHGGGSTSTANGFGSASGIGAATGPVSSGTGAATGPVSSGTGAATAATGPMAAIAFGAASAGAATGPVSASQIGTAGPSGGVEGAMQGVHSSEWSLF